MARKGENIYRRKDGRWEGRYIADRTEDGRAKYRSVYAKTYTQVKQKLQEAKEETQREQEKRHLPEIEKPFSEFLFQWLEYIQPRIKESSYVKYANLIELHIDKEIGAIQLGRLTPAVIDEFISTLLTGKEGTAPLSAKTATDILGVVRNVLRYINIRHQRIDCDLSQITIKKEETHMRILSREEEKELIRYLMEYPSPMNCGIFLTLFTGLRIGELCALTWEDIHLKEKELFIRKTMQRIQNKRPEPTQQEWGNRTKIIITPPKSSKSIRHIPLPDSVAEVLGEYQRYGHEYLLTGKENCYIEPRTLQYHFKKILRKSRIEEANYHALRHTFATRCIELGFDIKSLSEILGHASVNITLNRYVHPSMQLKRDNMEKLSGLIAG